MSYCESMCDRTEGQPTYCDECPEPLVLPENVEAVQFLNIIWSQIIYRPDGVIQGFSFPGIKVAAWHFNPIDERDLFYRVTIMQNTIVNISSEKAKAREYQD